MAKKTQAKEAKAKEPKEAAKTPVAAKPEPAPMKAVHEADVIRPTATSKSCTETVHVKACRDMLFGDMPVI